MIELQVARATGFGVEFVAPAADAASPAASNTIATFFTSRAYPGAP